MIAIDEGIAPAQLLPAIHRLWDVSGAKVRAIEERWGTQGPAPVFTVRGRYVTQGWTEWTLGFRYGSALLQFDATGDVTALKAGRDGTLLCMPEAVTHFGVHDHGFNVVSTFGNLWRLAQEGRLSADPWERRFYELALRCSGAVQARRWTRTAGGEGFIHSFNGPHSLFADTIRSLRSLALAHHLGPPSPRLGPRPGGSSSPLWRVDDVGRLSPSRAGALRRVDRPRPDLPCILWPSVTGHWAPRHSGESRNPGPRSNPGGVETVALPPIPGNAKCKVQSAKCKTQAWFGPARRNRRRETDSASRVATRREIGALGMSRR